MNEKTVRDYAKGIEAELYSAERDRICGEPVDDKLLLGLARRLIDAVNQLPEPSKRALRRRDEAEAVIQFYLPLPQTAPAEQPPYELTGMPSFWHT